MTLDPNQPDEDDSPLDYFLVGPILAGLAAWVIAILVAVLVVSSG